MTDVSFISSLYRNVLFREPDTAGLNYWVNQLSLGGVSRQSVQVSFLNSGEAQTFVAPVIRLYENILGRAPDAAGLNGWVNAIRNGTTTVDNITAQFLNSPEGQAAGWSGAGVTGQAFVTKLYTAMGRSAAQIAADPGAAAWAQALNTGALAPATAARLINESAENVQNTAGFTAGYLALRSAGNPAPTSAQANAFSSTAPTADIVTSANLVGNSAALPTGPGAGTSGGTTTTLTLGQDIINVGPNATIQAPVIFNAPSGTQIASWQTGDRLTSSGGSSTLNAVLTGNLIAESTGIATWNLTTQAATVITTPGTQVSDVTKVNATNGLADLTVGVAAAGSALKTALTDLGVVNQNNNVTVNVEVAALTGSADALAISLNNVTNGGTITVQTAVAGNGYETFNVNSTGGVNKLAALTDGNGTSLNTVNVTGDQALTITAALDASVKTFSASGMTGGGATVAFQAPSAGAESLAITGSGFNDSFDLSAAAGVFSTGDVINGGAGTDLLIARAAAGGGVAAIASNNANVTAIESFRVLSDAAGVDTATFDTTKLTGTTLTQVGVQAGDAGDNFVVTAQNSILSSSASAGTGFQLAGTTKFGTIGLTVKNADLSTTDALTVTVGSSATNTTAFNTGVITIADVETVTLNVADRAAHTLGGLTLAQANTLNVTGGFAGAATTITAAVEQATVNAATFAGDLSLTGVTAAGTVITQVVTLGTGNDTFVFSAGTPGAALAAANPRNVVTGGTGGDTFSFGATANTFSTASTLTGAAATSFDRITDLNLGGISTGTVGTANDVFVFTGAATAVAAGSAVIVNSGVAVDLSTATYTSLAAALNAVTNSGAGGLSLTGGGTAAGVNAANNTAVVGLFSYDGQTYLVAENVGGGAVGAYNNANNFIINVTGFTGTLDAWDVSFAV